MLLKFRPIVQSEAMLKAAKMMKRTVLPSWYYLKYNCIRAVQVPIDDEQLLDTEIIPALRKELTDKNPGEKFTVGEQALYERSIKGKEKPDVE